MRKKVISILRWIGLMPAYFLAFFITAAITSNVYKFAAGSSFIDYGTGSLSYNLDRVATFGFASFAGLYAVFKVAPDFNQRVVSVIAWTLILLNVLGMAVGILFLPDRSLRLSRSDRYCYRLICRPDCHEEIQSKARCEFAHAYRITITVAPWRIRSDLAASLFNSGPS